MGDRCGMPACVLIVLVLCFSREKFYTQMPQTRLYYACLGFALFSTCSISPQWC